MVGEFYVELITCRVRTVFHDYFFLDTKKLLKMMQTTLLATVSHDEKGAQKLYNAFVCSPIKGLPHNKNKE